MRAFVVGAAIVAFSASGAAPVAAQTEFGVTASFYSAYIWRGLSLTNKPVLQPDVSLAFPLGGASLTVGGWGNVELGAYDGEDDISQGGGTSLNLTEFDPYAEIGFSAGKAELAIGGIGYIYPNDVGATSDANTWEVYGKVGLGVPLNPSLGVYYDVSKVKGLYVEGSVSHDIPLGPKALTLGALVGYSSNMEPSEDDESFNFADNGLTHVDLSAEIEFGAGPFSITPTIHGIIGLDDATKFSKASQTEPDTKFKLWGGVSISWGKSFGGTAEE